MSLLTLSKVSKHYKQGQYTVNALQDIDMQLQSGEFTALVGPSGSGKTTLLNIIGGLDSPSSGSILLNQQEMTSFNETELAHFRLFEIGFVFQAYNLVPVLSALENVELIMVLQGRHKNDREQRASHYLELVGLKDMQHRRPSALSGGQQMHLPC